MEIGDDLMRDLYWAIWTIFWNFMFFFCGYYAGKWMQREGDEMEEIRKNLGISD